MIEMEPHEGRATIREVHQLLTETRHETESQLRNMEERITFSVNASETRILAAVGDLGMRVTALELWRTEQETNRAVGVASKQARAFYFRQVMGWLETHWKLITLVSMVVIAIFAIVIDVDVHTK